MTSSATGAAAPRSAPPRRVLLIAYHYPPMRSAGVERSAKFARYLPEFGYEPIVLSTAAFGGDRDAGVLRAWEPLGLYRRLLNPAARLDAPAATRTRTPGRTSRWLRRLHRHLLVPDGQVTWLPGAAWTALRALRRHGADVIYSTSPPASAHLLGRFLRAQTGLPWVADLRDAWLYDPLDPALLTMPYRRELERRMEAAVLADADAVIAATQTTAQDLRARYPAQAHKVQVVTNGYDPADGQLLPEGLVIDADARQGAPPMDAVDTIDTGDTVPRAHDELTEPGDLQEAEGDHTSPGATAPLRLVHTGSFAYSHPARSPVALLTALRRLYDLEPIWRERLELVLVGALSPEEEQAARDVARLEGAVDRAAALEHQRRADVLLVLDHQRPWPASNAPGKLFEYLATGKPLLALCGAGEVQRTVRELGAGLCALPDDVDAIEAVLRRLWSGHEAGDLPRVTADLTGYHRRELTRQLATCFDAVRSR